MNENPQYSVGFVSLGCAKNLVDSETIASSMLSAGLTLAASPEQADLVVVNTCAFIHDAREESVEAILEICELKKKGYCKAVLVAGCMPQRYKTDLTESLPEVDAFIGLDEISKAGEIALRVLSGERQIVEISKRAKAVIEPSGDRIVFSAVPCAYVKISEGCDHACAFCAIPSIRGRYRSRPLKNILREVEKLLEQGVRELNLVSQDITSYGCDLDSGSDLPALLKALGKTDGKFWVRLLYGHPGKTNKKLLETIAGIPQVCRYLDLPIQHSDSTILRTMGRKETESGLRNKFREIREFLPDIVLRTTCITGFPGETEKRFENLLAFLNEIRFNHVGVFEYSREENTTAAKWRAPPKTVAAHRKDILLHAQRKIVSRKARARVGENDEILVERKAPGKENIWIGRSQGLAPEVDGVVFLKSTNLLIPGDFIKARYTGFRGYDMLAIEENRGVSVN